jgi:universal stress protein family protein
MAPIRSILVTHDGSSSSAAALSHAISLCRSENARLGVAFIANKTELFAPLWPGPYVVPTVKCDVSRDVLGLVPHDIALRHLVWEQRIRTAGLITIAERLGCDAVLLPDRSQRCQRALRSAGLTVLVGPRKAGIRVWRSARGQTPLALPAVSR